MNKSRTQNHIHLFTTISVYLGLVLVGASPQVLAQASLAGDTQSRIFEISSKTGSVISKLKLRQESDRDDITMFPVAGAVPVRTERWCLFSGRQLTVPELPGTASSNEQVLTVSVLPRASI